MPPWMDIPERSDARWLELFMEAGLSEDEARLYIEERPREEWQEILIWARSPPGLDACDDYEADRFYA